MRSDYTANGRHKDDPTNPQSHWNDWSIDRDGNKLEERKYKKLSEYTEDELQIELNKRHTEKFTHAIDLIAKGLDELKLIGKDRDVLKGLLKQYGFNIK